MRESSDGVDEAQSISQEFFGVERISAVVRNSAKESAAMILQNIIDEVKSFSKGVSQFDDITVLVVKVKG